MSFTAILLVAFNIILWTVVRETLIEKYRSLGSAGLIVLGCFIVSLMSLALFS